MQEDVAVEAADLAPPPKPKRIRKAKVRITDKMKSQAETVTLAIQGKTATEISDIQGIPFTTVVGRLQCFDEVFEELKNVEGYRSRKADILEAAELMALKTIMTKLPKASCREAVYAFDRMAHYARLNNGQSTENHSHAVRFLGISNISDMRTPDK